MPERTDVIPAHEPDRKRWVVALEGELAVLDYSIDGGVMTIHHTIVPRTLGGRGIAGTLVRTALDHARAEGLRVWPDCSYAAAWIDKHPEYADLRHG